MASLVVKKNVKVRAIFDELGLEIMLDEFKEAFKEKYPKDWNRINDVYQEHERKRKPGKKGHPMPHPEKYLENTFKVYLKKLKQEEWEKRNTH